MTRNVGQISFAGTRGGGQIDNGHVGSLLKVNVASVN